MSKNIEIQINTGSNSYEVLYPKTDYNILLNKPTIPNLPLSIANGGTGQTTILETAKLFTPYFNYYDICDFTISGTTSYYYLNIPKLAALNRPPKFIFMRQYPNSIDYDYYFSLGPFIVSDYSSGNGIDTPCLRINKGTLQGYSVLHNSEPIFTYTAGGAGNWELTVYVEEFFYKVAGTKVSLIIFY